MKLSDPLKKWFVFLLTLCPAAKHADHYSCDKKKRRLFRHYISPTRHRPALLLLVGLRDSRPEVGRNKRRRENKKRAIDFGWLKWTMAIDLTPGCSALAISEFPSYKPLFIPYVLIKRPAISGSMKLLVSESLCKQMEDIRKGLWE
ncbi:hypothetical protein BgiBS90_005907 [Biomphalaria glabrata]|nr:hypothetical protein BgiBS90_005907 [Biomphalaria glabrata]